MRIDPESPLGRALAASSYPTRDEALALVRRAQAGDAAARDALVTGNLRLIARVASWYRRARSLEPADLIAEGVSGLLRAIELFDTRRDTAFNTYAVWWVRQRIAAAVADQDDLVRVPRDRRGRPSLVRASIDAPLPHADGDDGDAQTLGDLLADAGAEQPHEPAVRRELRQRIEVALDRLPHRDRLVLELRTGLRRGGDAGEAMTLSEVGRVMRVTRERVRQIQERALRRLAKRLAATPHTAAAS